VLAISATVRGATVDRNQLIEIDTDTEQKEWHFLLNVFIFALEVDA
jgi:hypothetical protein